MLFSQSVAASYIEVTLLGTGTPRPDVNRFGSSTLVEVKGKLFLFDTGRGTTIRLQQAGVPLRRIENIFYTHLHSDHTVGLADLLMTSWIWQRPHKLSVYGPTGTKDLVQNISQAFQKDMVYRAKNTGLNPDLNESIFHEFKSEQIVYDKEGIKITAFEVDHGVVHPAFGYKIQTDDTSVVISGDTTYSENLIKYAKDTDLLIHEIAATKASLLKRNLRLNKVMSYHTTPEQMATILNKAQPKYAVLTHVLLFGVDEQTVLKKIQASYKGQTVIGTDLLKIGIGDKVTIKN